MDAGRIQGEVPEGADFLNQALIVEVYQNKVLIKPRDIHNNDWTGEPFEISLPANKNNFKYTEKRRGKKAPKIFKRCNGFHRSRWNNRFQLKPLC